MTNMQEQYIKRLSFQEGLTQLINESGLSSFELHAILSSYTMEVAQILQNDERAAIQAYQAAAQTEQATEPVTVESVDMEESEDVESEEVEE